jgi:spore maturation protein CgeB
VTRYLHLTPFYPVHIEQFYAEYPGLADRPFIEQHDALLAEGFNWANYQHQQLRRYGYDTQHFVVNAEPMQKRWALENGVAYADDWYHNIALAQVQAFQPEILNANMSPEFIARARAVAPSLRLVFGWAGEPIVDAVRFRAHDLVLTCVQENLDFYRHAGLNCELLHHAFYPAVLQQLTPRTSHTSDGVGLGFIGNVIYGDRSHTRRARLLYDIFQHTDLALYGTVSDLEEAPYLGSALRGYARRAYLGGLVYLYRAGLDGLLRRLPRADAATERQKRRELKYIFDALRERAHPPVFGIKMYQLLSSFKVCLNTHAWSAYASNMRLYEATGVGTCLLTDWKQNIGELFEPDSEVVTYRCAEEAAEKARYLLDHLDERTAIARAGQQRTLSDHTVQRRTAELDQILKQYLQ